MQVCIGKIRSLGKKEINFNRWGNWGLVICCSEITFSHILMVPGKQGPLKTYAGLAEGGRL